MGAGDKKSAILRFLVGGPLHVLAKTKTFHHEGREGKKQRVLTTKYTKDTKQRMSRAENMENAKKESHHEGREGRKSGGTLTDEEWRCRVSHHAKGSEDSRSGNIIRLCTSRGRPLGSDSFMSKIEKTLGRRLRPLPVGRPKKEVK
jgi:hypothetical protein